MQARLTPVLGRAPVLSFSSGETLSNFTFYLRQLDTMGAFEKVPVIVPSERVAKMARQVFEQVVVASNAGFESFRAALAQIDESRQ